MYLSLAGSESLVLGFDNSATQVRVVMGEAPHGTPPAQGGIDLANPRAMNLASAAALTFVGRWSAEQAGLAIYEVTFEAVYHGIAAPELRGQSSTTVVTDEVIRRVEAKHEVGAPLP